jgi:hypothetical protein
MAAVVDCPVCACSLRIPDELSGDTLRCPTCDCAFTVPPALRVQPPPVQPAPVPTEILPPLEIEPRQIIPRVPQLKPMLVREEKGQPSRASPPSTRAAALLRDDGEDIPWPYRDCEPHRARLVLGLGIASLVLSVTCLLSVVGLPLGVAAVVMGRQDRRKMRAGTMDPEGQSTTQTGYICGIVGTVLNGLVVAYLGLSVLSQLLVMRF